MTMAFTRAATRLPAPTAAVLAMLLVMPGAAPAQWLRLPLPGTPRTPDGKPNLCENEKDVVHLFGKP